MNVRKILAFANNLEDPNHPLLGPNIKGLYWCGIWQLGTKFHINIYKIIHFLSVIFVISLYVELYQMKDDAMAVLINVSISMLSMVSMSKTLYTTIKGSCWIKLVKNISREELREIENNDPKIMGIIRSYTIHSRVISYGYWFMVFLTSTISILVPFVKYLTAPVHREMIKNGTEPYPQIMLSYFPFDNSKMPGYLIGLIIHIYMSCQGAACVCFFDSTAVTVMTFMKGYLRILKVKCETIFGEQTYYVSKSQVLLNIRECHRMHNFFIEQFKMFNDLLSPVMFIYVLVCSITICCSVVQLSIEGITFSQKLWVVEFATALSFQLFLYCWHSNEILYESLMLDQGVFNSSWWRADVQTKREMLLLAGKLSPSFILHAGPFSTFSMSTYIEIMKGSYSFYTLFTQMQENT